MNDDFKATNIIIASLADKGLTVQVIDSQKRKWVVWKKKYGTDLVSEAFGALQDLKIGMETGVSYKEAQKEYKGTQYTERTIYGFLPPLTAPISQPAINSRPGPVLSATEPVKDQAFWDKKAYKQCLWGYWITRVKLGEYDLTQEDIDMVWRKFSQIEKDADKRFSQPVSNEPAEDDPTNGELNPMINDEPELNVEDIPF